MTTAHSRASVRAAERLNPTGKGLSSSVNLPARPKPAASVRKSTASGNHHPRPSAAASSSDEDKDSCRVRVAARLRPKNPEDLQYDSDYTDCVELQPELKRVKLKRNNWNSESYKFDEVFAESASQKRIYEAVAKPVVESVLEGYNGTVMAYGQTGTGKTYTLGRLGKDDPSERGIMVRALEDVFANTVLGSDTVSVSYLQLYLESLQDLLVPEKTNISITEDSKTGEVTLPGLATIELRDLDHFLELLQVGEANRYAANTKLNTESSRSHAILAVQIQRSMRRKEDDGSSLTNTDLPSRRVPHMLKSKLLIVDLAGSERIDKSGCEGHMIEETKFINLSLTSLGKCINALAENSPHVPTRDSKLTRLLRDSFGGTARTSLIITIGPSARHYSETTSTILFGQRAMKIVNAVKVKEEVDYESLCRKLEYHVDYLTSETDRQQKLRELEKEQMEKKLKEHETILVEAEKSFGLKLVHMEKEKNKLELEKKSLLERLNGQKNEIDKLTQDFVLLEISLKQTKQQELENSTQRKALADNTQKYEKKIAELLKQLENERLRSANLEEELSEMKQYLTDNRKSVQMQDKVVDELQMEISRTREDSANQIQALKVSHEKLMSEKEYLSGELKAFQVKLQHDENQRRGLEEEVLKLKNLLDDENLEHESQRPHATDGISRSVSASALGVTMNSSKPKKLKETTNGQRDTLSTIFDEVGISNILSLLKSEDLNVQIHAVKVVANLAAEDINQERIVEEGGLDALLMLLETSEDANIQRVTCGAIANLAMNSSNQGLIVNNGGVKLLANVGSNTDDPQTLRMVAGAVANLCGNEKLHVTLRMDGGIKALLGMVNCRHNEVIAQIARGFANFAKCESRGFMQGYRRGRSLLIEDGALNWLATNLSSFSASTRRHIELALCHLAQNDDNTHDIVSCGGVEELIRISHESSREDIRNLAKKAVNSNPAFSALLQKF